MRLRLPRPCKADPTACGTRLCTACRCFLCWQTLLHYLLSEQSSPALNGDEPPRGCPAAATSLQPTVCPQHGNESQPPLLLWQPATAVVFAHIRVSLSGLSPTSPEAHPSAFRLLMVTLSQGREREGELKIMASTTCMSLGSSVCRDLRKSVARPASVAQVCSELCLFHCYSSSHQL